MPRILGALSIGLLLCGCLDRAVPAAAPDGGVQADLRPDSMSCSKEQLVCRGPLPQVCVCRPKNDSGLRPDPAAWSCNAEGSVCMKVDDNNGLPPGSKDSACHLATKNGQATWYCFGLSKGAAPPGGQGWTCTKFDNTPAGERYRCLRPDSPQERPPGGGHWVCYKGTRYGGHVCAKTPAPPAPPSITPGPCKPGQRMWCDGLTYSGWGQVSCDPATGMWKTVVHNGKKMLDCQSLSDGRRPNTLCACYHYYFNPICCERVDCVLPPTVTGQICPKGGGKLCDHCNPMLKECAEPGAACLVSNAHETFCGRDCASDGASCPSGYTCMMVKQKTGTTKQCVPSDISCYF
jgi:hypothetical protein